MKAASRIAIRQTLEWRAISLVLDSLIVYFLTGSLVLVGAFAAGDVLVKMTAFFLWRIWREGQRRE